MAIANALQLEAALSLQLQLRRHANFKVALPIHCRIIPFLLLIHSLRYDLDR